MKVSWTLLVAFAERSAARKQLCEDRHGTAQMQDNTEKSEIPAGVISEALGQFGKLMSRSADHDDIPAPKEYFKAMGGSESK